MNELSKLLISLGVILIAVGVFLQVAGKIPWVGRLPGDILVRRGSFTFYFPLVTCLLISFLLTILFNLFRRR